MSVRRNDAMASVFGNGGSGRDFARPTYNPELDWRHEKKPEEAVIQQFGIVDRNGKNILTGWKITEGRKIIDSGFKGQVGYASEYGKSLFESMFAGWD